MKVTSLIVSIHSWIVDLIWGLLLERNDFFHAWPNKNNLLETVNEGISNKLYLAEVTARGIADRVVENVDNMLEINPYLIQLIVSLSSISVDATPIFREDVFSKSYEDYLLNKDELYPKLFAELGDYESDVRPWNIFFMLS